MFSFRLLYQKKSRGEKTLVPVSDVDTKKTFLQGKATCPDGSTVNIESLQIEKWSVQRVQGQYRVWLLSSPVPRQKARLWYLLNPTANKAYVPLFEAWRKLLQAFNPLLMAIGYGPAPEEECDWLWPKSLSWDDVDAGVILDQVNQMQPGAVATLEEDPHFVCEQFLATLFEINYAGVSRKYCNPRWLTLEEYFLHGQRHKGKYPARIRSSSDKSSAAASSATSGGGQRKKKRSNRRGGDDEEDDDDDDSDAAGDNDGGRREEEDDDEGGGNALLSELALGGLREDSASSKIRCSVCKRMTRHWTEKEKAGAQHYFWDAKGNAILLEGAPPCGEELGTAFKASHKKKSQKRRGIENLRTHGYNGNIGSSNNGKNSFELSYGRAKCILCPQTFKLPDHAAQFEEHLKDHLESDLTLETTTNIRNQLRIRVAVENLFEKK